MTDGKIMDEATASVDFATDEAIQSAIRSEFKSSTLLTIAHRLSSVIDYDRLLVLSDGKVAEFDTPIVSLPFNLSFIASYDPILSLSSAVWPD